MDDQAIADTLEKQGFVCLSSEAVKTRLPDEAHAEWDEFALSWKDLGEDLYMADGGRYRRRRHAVFRLEDRLTRLPAQPHYQSRDYNPLNGGVERWFAPVLPEICASSVLLSLVEMAQDFIALETGAAAPTLFVEMHQFRVETSAKTKGMPTPEGMHRDGVDWVMVAMINRENVSEGVTRLCGPNREPLGEFTLSNPLDMVFLDDWRVFHGVTPISAQNPRNPGKRDVLVLTFRREKP